MSTPIVPIPSAAALNLESDRTLHESLKSWEGYADLRLPKSIFWKLQPIKSKAFTDENPLTVKIRYRGKIRYGYQRANAARADGAQLQQKRFNLPSPLCDALASRAAAEKRTQTAVVEDAIAAYCADDNQL